MRARTAPVAAAGSVAQWAVALSSGTGGSDGSQPRDAQPGTEAAGKTWRPPCSLCCSQTRSSEVGSPASAQP
jgi:hypothetical protein